VKSPVRAGSRNANGPAVVFGRSIGPSLVCRLGTFDPFQ
jgi:hypothetical protein